jgi:DNA invertase Pin-like site-specific DNA recombinase
MTVPLRAALYLRVSTARQAEHDVSIPDQKRQGEAYCASRGYQLIETYVEPGASATNDRRPEFQRMIEAGTSKPAPFDIVIVHSFSRFFRDHFELEFYVRRLAKNGVRLVSITQEVGDDPMHVMMRQIMALLDEYQSKENAKHVLRALKENARQGFWNGSLPPIGYRVVAAEQRGAKVKNKLEIDPLHADTVRLIYRLALEGDGTSGPMGVKNIAVYLNRHRISTRDGGRWGIGQVHRILTRTTYIGRHELNKRAKNKTLKPASEIVGRGRGAAADRSGDLRCCAGASARPQPQGHASARPQRPDPPYRHLLLRRLRRRDDAQDRDGRTVSLLYVLDQSAAGRDRLQRTVDPDGEARQPRCRAHRRSVAPAGAARGSPGVHPRPPAGTCRAPPRAHRRTEQQTSRNRAENGQNIGHYSPGLPDTVERLFR